MRKYLKFILSIIILAVILQPLLKLNNIDINAFEPISTVMETPEEPHRDSVESIQEVQIISLFKQKLKSNIISIIWDINSELDIKEITIHVFENINKKNFGEIHSVDIRLIGSSGNESDKTKIVNEVAQMLDVSNGKISVRINE